MQLSAVPWLAAALALSGCHCREPKAPVVEPSNPEDTTDTPGSSLPENVASLHWVVAEAGDLMNCALRSDGTVSCWGQCETEVPTEPLLQLSVGFDTACGLDRSGELLCWCCDTDPDRANPVCNRAPPQGPFDRVEVGSSGFACARYADSGTLTCFGSRSLDRLGEIPTEPVIDFEVEINAACAVKEDGTIACWGNSFLWDEDWMPLDHEYVEVEVGRQHGCALDTDGNVHCWGDDWEDQPFAEPPPGPFVTIASSHQLAGGLREDGSVAQWGWYQFVESPYFAVPDETFVQFRYGAYHACGVVDEGKRIVCWGSARADGSNLEPPRLRDRGEPEED